MAISDLSAEEKIKLNEKYKELNIIVKQKEELDINVTPLCDKLTELEEEENKLDAEYAEIFLSSSSGFTSEQTERLADIASRNVEISNEKEKINSQLRDLSEDFHNIRNEENILKDEIQALVEKKQGSIFSQNDEVIRLDKNGNVVDKIVVDSSNFSKIKEAAEQHVNRAKNTITKTTPKVLNVMSSNYKKVKTFTYDLSSKMVDKLSTFVQKIKATAVEIKDEFMEGYKEEEQRVQSMLDHYYKVKEENEKIEDAASNLEFASSVPITDEVNENLNEVASDNNVIENMPVNSDINENLYYPRLEDQEAKEEGFNFVEESISVLPVDSVEVEEAKTIHIDEVVNTIDNNQVQEPVAEVSSIITESKEEPSIEPEITSQSIADYKQKDHFIQTKKNKIARSNKTKLANMTAIFGMTKQFASNIGKKVAEFKTNKQVNDAKKEAIKELDEKNNQEISNIKDEMRAKKAELEELQRKQIENAQKNYDSQIDALESIFGGQSLAA